MHTVKSSGLRDKIVHTRDQADEAIIEPLWHSILLNTASGIGNMLAAKTQVNHDVLMTWATAKYRTC